MSNWFGSSYIPPFNSLSIYRLLVSGWATQYMRQKDKLVEKFQKLALAVQSWHFCKFITSLLAKSSRRPLRARFYEVTFTRCRLCTADFALQSRLSVWQQEGFHTTASLELLNKPHHLSSQSKSEKDKKRVDNDMNNQPVGYATGGKPSKSRFQPSKITLTKHSWWGKLASQKAQSGY